MTKPNYFSPKPPTEAQSLINPLTKGVVIRWNTAVIAENGLVPTQWNSQAPRLSADGMTHLFYGRDTGAAIGPYFVWTEKTVIWCPAVRGEHVKIAARLGQLKLPQFVCRTGSLYTRTVTVAEFFLGGWGITVADFQSCVGHLNIPVSDK